MRSPTRVSDFVSRMAGQICSRLARSALHLSLHLRPHLGFGNGTRTSTLALRPPRTCDWTCVFPWYLFLTAALSFKKGFQPEL